MADGYLIGENLRRHLGAIVRRGESVQKVGVTRIQTRFDGDMPPRSGGGRFRICTFTGAWSKTGEKTVTFRGVTATPNTVLATNLFASIAAASGSRNCAIARDGTAWYLIAAECG